MHQRMRQRIAGFAVAMLAVMIGVVFMPGSPAHADATVAWNVSLDGVVKPERLLTHPDGKVTVADCGPHSGYDLAAKVNHEAEQRSRPSAVLVNSFVCPSKTDKPDGGAVRLGLHMITLVPPAGHSKHPAQSGPAQANGFGRRWSPLVMRGSRSWAAGSGC
jgi:hypothetical protein